MEKSEFIKHQDLLIERWCDRRELKPLRRFLNGIAALNGLTDGFEDMLTELRTIRGLDRVCLKEDELEIVIELIHDIEDALERR